MTADASAVIIDTTQGLRGAEPAAEEVLVSRGQNRAAQALLARKQMMANDDESDSDIFGSEGDRPAIANALSQSDKELSEISDCEKRIPQHGGLPSSSSEYGDESGEAEEEAPARPIFLKKEDRDLLYQNEQLRQD